MSLVASGCSFSHMGWKVAVRRPAAAPGAARRARPRRPSHRVRTRDPTGGRAHRTTVNGKPIGMPSNSSAPRVPAVSFAVVSTLAPPSDKSVTRPVNGPIPATVIRHGRLTSCRGPTAAIDLRGGGPDDAHHRAAKRADQFREAGRVDLNVGGVFPGFAGLGGDLRDPAGDLIGGIRGLRDVAGDFGGRGALFLHGRGDRIGDGVHLGDGALDQADRGDGGTGRGADLGQMSADLLGGAGGLGGELLDLAGHDREASAGLSGPGGLDRGVQGQQVGFRRDVADHVSHGADALHLAVQAPRWSRERPRRRRPRAGRQPMTDRPDR